MHPIALLNASVVTADGQYTVRTVDPDEARALVAASVGVESAVGHPATAEIMSGLLGRPVPVSRHLFAQQKGQSALIFKLSGRPESGRELSREDLEQIGYTWRVLTRIA